MRNRLLAALTWLSCTVAFAEKADREKPIEVTADNGSWDQLRDVTEWQGNVVVVQGTLKVNADHAVVTRDAQGNQTLVATGKLVTFQQKLDTSNTHKEEWITGQGSRVDYTSITHQAILTGNARVKKGDSIVIGEVITYNTETQVVESRGGVATSPNKGRVTAILPPRKPPTEPAANRKGL